MEQELINKKPPLNKDHSWLTIREVKKNKRVTERVIYRACLNDRLDYESIIRYGKVTIFVVVNEKYRSFSNTSKLKLDMNALIRYTNKKIGKV